ncbi:MAG: segregation/condensation protein A [Alphaproteobacteria bacterium]|nr:segregation/condensation protein A [Alphaproteobacteria bacterium]
MTYIVQTEDFTGPLEVLYELIEKRKKHISTIALKDIVDDFLGYTKTLTTYPTEEITKFIYIASLLVLLKARSLLPTLTLNDSEINELKNLESRIELYTFLKQKVILHMQRFSVYSRSGSCVVKKKEIVFSPEAAPNQEEIYASAKRVLSDVSFIAITPHRRVEKTIRIEEMISAIISHVAQKLKASFKDISHGKHKYDVVVSFLAVLELVKNNILDAFQEKMTGDIVITKRNEEQEISTYHAKV